MSTFSNPWQALPGVDEWNRMSAEFTTPLQKDFSAVMSLVANPTATLAAASAVGFGLAVHTVGFWAGVIAGTAQASQRLFAPLEGGSVAAEGRRPSGEVVAMPKRSKPALKVVPKDEPVEAKSTEPVPAAEPEKIAPVSARPEPIAKADKLAVTEPVKAEVAELQTAEAVMPAKAEPAKPVKAKAATPAKGSSAEPAGIAPAELSSKRPRKPRTIQRPETPDDLKAISGIGPKLEQVLNKLGVWTYAQIAAWDSQEIAWVDDYLSFKGRIDRDGWLVQAAKLAAGSRGK